MKNKRLITLAALMLLVITLAAGALKAQLYLPVKPDINAAKTLKFDYNSTDYRFHEGLCALQKNNLWGFIDTLGIWVIEPQYFKWGSGIPTFSDGICLVAIKDPKGYGNIPVYINKKGEQLFKNQSFIAASPFSQGVALVGKSAGPGKPEVYLFINSQGATIVGTVIPKFKGWSFEFGPYGDGLTRMWDDKLDSYGFVDTKGKWAIKPESKKWEDADQFSEGLCAVQNTINFYWGYIDKTGATKVTFDYRNKPNRFVSGRALVVNDRYQAGYIGPDGNMAIPFRFTQNSFQFCNGFALVTLDNPQLTKAIIDTKGEVVKQLDAYNDPYVNADGTIVFQPRGQDGLQVLYPDGKLMIGDAYYNTIGPFGDNRAYVEFYKDGYQSGFINREGKLMILRAE